VSLFIGGGFWAGLIIGVLTGIFMIMYERRPPMAWHP
jgi:multisubunit Na+/H+ antiporter MnhB subunit